MLIQVHNREALSSHITGSSCEPCNEKLRRSINRKLKKPLIEKITKTHLSGRS
ncbi:hypothetical protein F383_04078 [Gossypium arboreum]|uniref:Uncharacterized protein n=1 Tax=Gossypium arboreum TaxID=29729 RepID=A0A0B0NBX4_GOSAR|nr:hypothetical protein F383_04078 [Gossypium arboreum]